jgi:hypothetical protein
MDELEFRIFPEIGFNNNDSIQNIEDWLSEIKKYINPTGNTEIMIVYKI